MIWSTGASPQPGVALMCSSFADPSQFADKAVYGTKVPWFYSAVEWMSYDVDSNQYLIVCTCLQVL